MKTFIMALVMVLISTNIYAADYVIVNCNDEERHLVLAISITIDNELDKNILESCPAAIRRNAELKELNVLSPEHRAEVLKYEMIRRNADGSRAGALRNIWVYK